PCYPIYVVKLVYEWVLSLGGLEEMKKINEKKAAILYDYLDSTDYYIAPTEKEARSMMNVTFVTGDADLDKKFAKEADAAGLKNIKGHRSVGGMRASIYNAMPIEGVETLVQFMKDFAAANPKA
ncbi:MAG: aminotransferase class V-fold PLP-dependent enzyme, partial [Clostridia bacterium]|nr:aminotransferase class V-fold PLP-dependent enzyme [Clostridia bacterium]